MIIHTSGTAAGLELSLQLAGFEATVVEVSWHGDRRVPVPLLYTGTAPEIVNDTTMRARLSDGCAPGDAYLVNLRTGRPVRER